GRTVLHRTTTHIPDVLPDPSYMPLHMQRAGGDRTILGVPLMRDGFPIGVISLTRIEVQPFTERQIQLVETFAAQAVIAIENVRLFNETQEALSQQTATADVLQTISRATFDLPTVLETLIEQAVALCDADDGLVRQRE